MSRSLTIGVAAALGVAALIAGAIREGRERATIQTLAVLPSTARAVFRVDLDGLAAVVADSDLLSGFAAEAPRRDIEETCGLDPLVDLREVTLWVRGPDDRPLESFGLMLEGRTVGAPELAECHKRLVERRGDDVVRIEAPSGALLSSRDRASAIGVIDARTVVTGSPRAVAEALAARRGLVPTLNERVSLIDLWTSVGRGAAITAVVEPPEHWRAALDRVGTLGSDGSPFAGVDAIALGAFHDAEPNMRVVAVFDTPAQAAASAQRLAAWADDPPASVVPPWNDVLGSAQVSEEGSRVELVSSLRALLQGP